MQFEQPHVKVAPVQNFRTPESPTIEAPAHPISDFVNQPQAAAQNNQPTTPIVSGERVVQPIENSRSDEEILSFQINDILKGGTGENPLNNNSQPPFGAQ